MKNRFDEIMADLNQSKLSLDSLQYALSLMAANGENDTEKILTLCTTVLSKTSFDLNDIINRIDENLIQNPNIVDT